MLPEFVIPLLGVLGICFALWQYVSVRREDEGTDRMRRIADQIHSGAMVFLRREYSIIVVFAIIVVSTCIKNNIYYIVPGIHF